MRGAGAVLIGWDKKALSILKHCLVTKYNAEAEKGSDKWGKT